MPELPEVETVVRMLRPDVVGRRIDALEVLWERTVARPDVETFREQMAGARFTALGRRGKFLVFSLDTGRTLLVHLRMSGKFLVRTADEGPGDHPHARVRMRLDDGRWLLFVNQRKFGRFYLLDDPGEVLDCLGPEPLAEDFTPEAFSASLARRRGEIKRLLLDQTFVAGLGNIYANEALWRAHIHPQRRAQTLNADEAARLHTAIVETLRAGIAEGGTSLADRQYVFPDGRVGGYQERLAVYDRTGDTCPRCGYALVRIVQGQRSTYFCPVCQPET